MGLRHIELKESYLVTGLLLISVESDLTESHHYVNFIIPSEHDPASSYAVVKYIRINVDVLCLQCVLIYTVSS
jgi:hypothetical protein